MPEHKVTELRERPGKAQSLVPTGAREAVGKGMSPLVCSASHCVASSVRGGVQKEGRLTAYIAAQTSFTKRTIGQEPAVALVCLPY